MTEFQISLIVIGVIVIVGILGYNKWTEHRGRKNIERAFPDQPVDALMNQSEKQDAQTRQEPKLDGAQPQESTSQSLGQTQTIDYFTPDKIIDWPVDLNIDGTILGEKLMPYVQKLRQIGGKPIHFLGQAVGEDAAENLVPIVPNTVYSKIQAYVQLANRNGALTEIEFSELMTALQQIAVAINAEPVVPDMHEVTLRAKQLYGFVLAHAVKLGISLRSNTDAWPIEPLCAALESTGFEKRPDGIFIMRDEETRSQLFNLSINEPQTSDKATRLTMLMNVPCVSPELKGFEKMISSANALCVRLDATIVDDANQTLTPEFIKEIATQVDAYYTEMQQFAINSGSLTAIRLFG